MNARTFLFLIATAGTACEWQTRPDAPPTSSVAADSAVGAPDSARMLYEIGLIELQREGFDSATIAYMQARPEHFFYNEFHDFYAYNGHHFREVGRRFPGSDVADDAAYQLTKLKSQNQECEGWVPCYIHTTWDPLAEFLFAHPTSLFADSAVARALEVFGTHLNPARQAVDFYQNNPAEMDTILMRFDSVTRILPPTLRTRTDSALLQWRTWLQNPTR